MQYIDKNDTVAHYTPILFDINIDKIVLAPISLSFRKSDHTVYDSWEAFKWCRVSYNAQEKKNAAEWSMQKREHVAVGTECSNLLHVVGNVH